MGQKAGKHARDGVDGEGSPSPKRSPKRSSKRGSKSSSRESTPNPDLPTFEQEPRRSRQDIQRDVQLEIEKENPKKSPTKSPPRSPPKKAKGEPKSKSLLSKIKSPKKSAVHEVQEEPMTVEQTMGEQGQLPLKDPPQTPVKLEGSRHMDPMTPLNIDTSVAHHHPQATSTPAANGVVGTGVQPSSPPLSPGSTTDQSDDEAYTPTEQQCLMHTLTGMCFPAKFWPSSKGPALTEEELAARQQEPNFGRFYTTSYLEGSKSGYLRSGNALDKDRSKSPHFHRPSNFSYGKDPPEFLKKKGSGMSALATGKRVVKVRRSSSPGGDLKNEEPIRMSMLPGGKPKAPNEPDKIERDDWPGPASPAAILSEILRERRRSRGELPDEDEDEQVPDDPKILREMEEISKIKDESGIGKVIFQELAELKHKPAKPVDPWKASRVPSAKYEPRYHTRYQSPMFASPSRFIDATRRSWDDHDIRGYRSVSTLANLPTARPGYGPAYSTPRAATLPVSGMYGGRDLTYFGFRDESGDSEIHQRSNYTSTSTLTGDSLSRGRSGVSSVAAYDVPSIPLLKLQKSTWHTECDPPVYDYEKLKITNFDLPRDVDRNKLEIHLNDEDFSRMFKMPRDRFFRLAEWKRNDMKKKFDLY
ncbi:actin-binding LIM protein 1-like isoform X2 [Littorina saxatilis]